MSVQVQYRASRYVQFKSQVDHKDLARQRLCFLQVVLKR